MDTVICWQCGGNGNCAHYDHIFDEVIDEPCDVCRGIGHAPMSQYSLKPIKPGEKSFLEEAIERLTRGSKNG